jgi:hypothetical protein
MAIRLRPGTDPNKASQVLNDIAARWHNLINSAGKDPDLYRDDYARVTCDVERDLRNISLDPALPRILQTDRFWHLMVMGSGTHLRLLVTSEAEAQGRAWLEVADELNKRAKGLSAAPGWPTIVDTNVLLHCMRPDQIKWPQVVSHDPVRLIVPLRVIEELDAKKYGPNQHLSDVARSLLPWLEVILGPSSLGPVPVGRDSTTIEVLIDDGPRVRPADADQEVLNVCAEVESLTSRTVAIVTSDTAMRLRAAAAGFEPRQIPDTWRRKSEASLS